MENIDVVSLHLVREKSVPYANRELLGPDQAYELFHELISDLDRETVWVICLDTRHHIVCISQIAVGLLSSTLMHPREVFKVVLVANAKAMMLLHNHPSGDPLPSPQDFVITRRLKEAAELLGIDFLDHLIIGSEGYYSFSDHGGL